MSDGEKTADSPSARNERPWDAAPCLWKFSCWLHSGSHPGAIRPEDRGPDRAVPTTLVPTPWRPAPEARRRCSHSCPQDQENENPASVAADVRGVERGWNGKATGWACDWAYEYYPRPLQQATSGNYDLYSALDLWNAAVFPPGWKKPDDWALEGWQFGR